MTYKEIINRIRTVAENHFMIKDFGYGELSDIKTQAQFGPTGNRVLPDNKEADYPYMFLLPAGSTRNDPVVNYNFSMIMMDLARGEEGDKYDNYLTIQSQCQQYIDDVLANLYYYYRDQPMVQLTGITYTPFKEAYQDEVAGMTCNFTIEVPNGLNSCIAPISNLYEWFRNIGGANYGGYYAPGGPQQGLPRFGSINEKEFGIYPQNWNGDAAFTWGQSQSQPPPKNVEQQWSKVTVSFDMEYVPYGNDPIGTYPMSGFNIASSQGRFLGDLGLPPTTSNFPDQVSDIIQGTTYPVVLEWINPILPSTSPQNTWGFYVTWNDPLGIENPNNAMALLTNINIQTYT